MSWRRVIPLIAVLVLALGPEAWAGAPTEQLRTYTDQVVKILQNPSMTLPDRREAVRHLAEEVFDVTETAKRALGQHWQQRTPAEQDEFVKLFANLLEQTYITRADMARASLSSIAPRPVTTPSRSAAGLFWLTFHLPTSLVSGISIPTMAPSICSTKSAGASVTFQGSGLPASWRAVSRSTSPRSHARSSTMRIGP